MSKQRVKDPRKKMGEGKLMYEVRYAKADIHTGYMREAIENLCSTIEDAQKSFPKINVLQRGNKTNPDALEFYSWFKEWLSEST